MTDAPKHLQADRAGGRLKITWQDDSHCDVPFRTIRLECPCAGCVNEFTGERILDPATVPQDVKPEHMELVGNYALKIRWSDGHETGLFTWDSLHQICRTHGR